MSFRSAFTSTRSRVSRLDPPRDAGFSPVPLEGPRAARRLLQSKRFVSTTAELFEPCPPRVRSPSRGARTAGGAAFDFALPRRVMRGQPSMSRARGRRGLRLGAAPPEAIARAPKLCPNPIDPDTPCRSLVTSPAGGADDARRSRASLRACRRTSRRPRRSYQGRLTRSSAKRSAIRCTQGAFHRRTALVRELRFLHKLSPVCGVLAGASSTHALAGP